MGTTLKILALEPYFGGVRRAMLESLQQCSEHHWTIQKLPARRLERRLLVAATWFAESLPREEIGDYDALFVSEALNLADLLRMVPELSRIPSLVYFHDNELPDVNETHPETPADLVNLNSALAATEIWFNSLYNLRSFLSRAAGIITRHRELETRNLIPDLGAKAQIIPPPIDLAAVRDVTGRAISRNLHHLLIDARGVAPELVSEALAQLKRPREKEKLRLSIVGRVESLPADAEVTILPESDVAAQNQAMAQAGICVCLCGTSTTDDFAIRALAGGCFPVFPGTGVYPELLPTALHEACLHNCSAQSVAERILDAWFLDPPTGYQPELAEILSQFESARACKLIDQQLENLVVSQALRK